MTPKPKLTPQTIKTPAPPRAPAPPVFREDVPAGMALRWTDARRVLADLLKTNTVRAMELQNTSAGGAHELAMLKIDQTDVVIRALIAQIDRMPDRGLIMAEGDPDAFKFERKKG